MREWLQFALIALFAVATLYGGWVVFKPSLEAGDVFFKGGGVAMLQLYVVYLIAICFIGFLVVFLKWRWENDR